MKDKGVELMDGELAKLIEPGALSATLSDNQKNGYDISCHGGNDGNITNTVNGVASFCISCSWAA